MFYEFIILGIVRIIIRIANINCEFFLIIIYIFFRKQNNQIIKIEYIFILIFEMRITILYYNLINYTRIFYHYQYDLF